MWNLSLTLMHGRKKWNVKHYRHIVQVHFSLLLLTRSTTASPRIFEWGRSGSKPKKLSTPKKFLFGFGPVSFVDKLFIFLINIREQKQNFRGGRPPVLKSAGVGTPPTRGAVKGRGLWGHVSLEVTFFEFIFYFVKLGQFWKIVGQVRWLPFLRGSPWTPWKSGPWKLKGFFDFLFC